MTAEEFDKFWTSTYPDTIPISHYFRHDYAERWFRIHSLPDSKRYAEDEEEWSILLGRQNTILNDLLENNAPVLLVTGDYHLEGYTELHPISEVKSIQDFEFTYLRPIDLHKLSADQYEPGHTYRPMFCKEVWQSHRFDNLLRDIAQDELRAFFISINNNCIVAPYDGGIDILVKDTKTRDAYKQKYQEWLSERQDGL